jgi:hypothetical protein
MEELQKLTCNVKEIVASSIFTLKKTLMSGIQWQIWPTPKRYWDQYGTRQPAASWLQIDVEVASSSSSATLSPFFFFTEKE